MPLVQHLSCKHLALPFILPLLIKLMERNHLSNFNQETQVLQVLIFWCGLFSFKDNYQDEALVSSFVYPWQFVSSYDK